MSTLHYPIRLPSDILEALGTFTGHFWSDSLALEPFVCEALRNYMQPTPTEQAAALSEPEPESKPGYQWKQVFLPAGTLLRASFHGRNYFAKVVGDEIRFNGQALSPSRFANLQGSGNRNAWKAVWLCFPGSDAWLPAAICRSARKAAIAQLLAGGVLAERRAPPPAARHSAPGESLSGQPGSCQGSAGGAGEALAMDSAGSRHQNGVKHGEHGKRGRHGKRGKRGKHRATRRRAKSP